MGKRVDSWVVTDALWQRVEPLVPQRALVAGKQYVRKPGAGRPAKPARLDRKSNRMSTSIAHVWGVSGMHTGDCWVDFSKPVARDFSV